MAARALETLGLSKGSAIAIDMPMTVTAVVIYLAIVSAGFVVVSIADSFAPVEISTRLKISNAKAVFTQVSYRFHLPQLDKISLNESVSRYSLVVVFISQNSANSFFHIKLRAQCYLCFSDGI